MVRYKNLIVVSAILKVLAVILVLGAIVFGLWWLLSGERSWLDRAYVIFGIGGSVVFGVVVYSFGEVIGCLVDRWLEK